MAINKVVYGNTTIMDITDTTAEAADVASGKYFYTASGVKAEGTGSGGGGISADDIATYNYSEVTGVSASFIASYAFCSNTALVSASFPECKVIHSCAFSGAKKLKTAYFPLCETIESSAFYGCSSLTTASFPSCLTVSGYAFSGCRNISEISFPECQAVGLSAFCYTKITEVNLPNCNRIDTRAFFNCKNLSKVTGRPTSIGGNAFQNCYNLIEFHLETVSGVPTIASNTFSTTPIGGYSTSAGRYGSVFVPASLYSAFQTAANWSAIASRLVSV